MIDYVIFQVVDCTLQPNPKELSTLSDVLEKRQMSSFLSPGACLKFAHSVGSGFPLFSCTCSSIWSSFANSRSSIFGLSIYKKYSLAGFEPTTSTSVVMQPTIEPPGTPSRWGRRPGVGNKGGGFGAVFAFGYPWSLRLFFARVLGYKGVTPSFSEVVHLRSSISHATTEIEK